MPTHKFALYFAVLIMITLKDKEAVKHQDIVGVPTKVPQCFAFLGFIIFDDFVSSYEARGTDMAK